MGWAIGYDSNWGRDIGYGVIAYCDHPDCNPSWKVWRDECPEECREFQAMWDKLSPDVQALAEARTQKELDDTL